MGFVEYIQVLENIQIIYFYLRIYVLYVSLTNIFIDIRRRIELIQDFDMPGVSTSIKLSKDGQYILATGIYKPRVKCFDVNNLSLKFERCFDSEVITFEVLSNDYSKVNI